MIKPLVGLSSALFSLSAIAAEQGQSAHMAASSIVSMVLSLIVVLITIFLCAWVLKKTRVSQFAGGQAKVVANLALGARERVTVVEVGGQQYLLGVTAQQVNLLDKLDTPIAAKQVSASSFAQILSRKQTTDEA